MKEGGGTFRANRGVREGSYALAILEGELHPSVAGEGIQPGLGAKAHVEVARGGLEWQRTELALWSRTDWKTITLELDANAGAVFGAALPPQTLFELGGERTLPGYDYKEFAGDRAALFRAYAGYGLQRWQRPHRVWRNLYLPGVAPGLAIAVQGGWTSITSVAARTAIAELGPPLAASAISRATDGVRATFGGGITLFSGVMHLGIARPVDHPAPWRVVWGVGRSF